MEAIRVAEMFAGVGGFRLALDGYNGDGWDIPPAGPFKTVWANQWEPPGTDAKQFAWRCYETRFGEGSCVNRDINFVLDDVEAGKLELPAFDMLVGGFPCQDYSVAKPLPMAGGIEGKKGVLWWEIYRMVHIMRPRYLLLENVDRLLKSPASQRGRDFAIMLSCLADEGYAVEWRVINAADYGMPQRRRRVYIYGERDAEAWDLEQRTLSDGVIAEAFPVGDMVASDTFTVDGDPYEVSQSFGKGAKVSPFMVAGCMQRGEVFTAKTVPAYDGERMTLGDVVVSDDEVPPEYYIDGAALDKWRYMKGAKHEPRVARNGHHYTYSEGPVAFPDPLDGPARTILTSEGGRGASRTKHAIETGKGYRRLVPDELDQLQMFPKGWTATGMTNGQRAFCMGNALVVGIPHRIGQVIAARA